MNRKKKEEAHKHARKERRVRRIQASFRKAKRPAASTLLHLPIHVVHASPPTHLDVELIGRSLLVELGHVDAGADASQTVIGGIVGCRGGDAVNAISTTTQVRNMKRMHKEMHGNRCMAKKADGSDGDGASGPVCRLCALLEQFRLSDRRCCSLHRRPCKRCTHCKCARADGWSI